MKVTRRQFMKGTIMTGAVIAASGTGVLWKPKTAHAFYQSPGLTKWAMPFRSAGLNPSGIPVALPDASPAPVTGVTHYTIDIVQFPDTLHSSFANPTTLWGFNPAFALDPAHLATPFPNPTPTHLGGIIIAQKGQPIQITFRNRLTDNGTSTGTPLFNIIPVDTSVLGANQAQNRTAIHLHGGFIPWISDGGPHDWFDPYGGHGLSFLNNDVLNSGAADGEAEYYYGNNQSARLLWYHDHAWGITRINAYAGIASAYIIRDSAELSLVAQGLPPYIETSVTQGLPVQEIPIIVQDKIFVGPSLATDPKWPSTCPQTPGSLWYAHTYDPRRWKVRAPGRGIPEPSVIAEFFGDTMLANGTVYPELNVEPRRYRLRVLNACNARFLNLQLLVEDTATYPIEGIGIDGSGNAQNLAGPDWLVIGTEGGFLEKPTVVPSKQNFALDGNGVPTGSLITAPAERWDIIVDFSAYANKNLILYTDAPAPFPGGDPLNDYYPGAPNPTLTTPGLGPNTRTIMRFVVGNSVTAPADPPLSIDTTSLMPGLDPFIVPFSEIQAITDIQTWLASKLSSNPTWTLRQLTLNEQFDEKGRLVQMIGTNVPKTAGSFGRPYMDSATEKDIKAGSTEIWQITNLTGDTHPIHFHLVNLQIIGRQAFNPARFNGTPNLIAGTFRHPDATEVGWKETIRMNPGEVIWVIATFTLPADPPNVTIPMSPRTGINGFEYVYHCHILEHEEHDMMRPLVVIP